MIPEHLVFYKAESAHVKRLIAMLQTSLSCVPFTRAVQWSLQGFGAWPLHTLRWHTRGRLLLRLPNVLVLLPQLRQQYI